MMNQRLVPHAIEPRGVVAHYEPGKESMTIWSSTQRPAHPPLDDRRDERLARTMSGRFAPEVGGGFGAKITSMPRSTLRRDLEALGVPVKWVEDRSEAFVATTHGRDIIGYVDLAAKRDGKVVGLNCG